jgi:hypothetical protein
MQLSRLEKIIITLLVMAFCFMGGYFYHVVFEYKIKADISEIRSEVQNLHKVSSEVMLYKTIEDVWFEKGSDYMNHQILRELAYITYRYHQKYGTDGEIPIGLDHWRIFAWIDIESRFDPQAESYAGAIGLTQHMPITGIDGLDRYFDMQGLSKAQVLEYLRDPVWSLRLGLERLVDYQTDFIASGYASDTDWKLTFSMYNWSTQAVSNLMQAMESGTPKASLKYALDIEKRLQTYRNGI